MSNDFFSKKICDRCGGSLEGGRICSMFNDQTICLKCKQEETHHPKYEEAVKADNEEIKKGNYNFKGIGH